MRQMPMARIADPPRPFVSALWAAQLHIKS
jgi:hypothetical protein